MGTGHLYLDPWHCHKRDSHNHQTLPSRVSSLELHLAPTPHHHCMAPTLVRLEQILSLVGPKVVLDRWTVALSTSTVASIRFAHRLQPSTFDDCHKAVVLHQVDRLHSTRAVLRLTAKIGFLYSYLEILKDPAP